MKLKAYQQAALDSLRRFLEEARVVGPAAAHESLTGTPEQRERLGAMRQPYKPLPGLEQVPYACLRLPTGGGKTLLGCHAIAVARDAWIEAEFPLVLWLVPSDVIRNQTVDALKNPAHSYRQALNAAFDGNVRIFDIEDYSQIRPHDLGTNCCIVVGTVQSLRIRQMSLRKVYAHHEELEGHFTGRDLAAPGLQRGEDGKVLMSFANLLHLTRPLMIVDEAQNVVGDLSREMQQRLNPCAVIEFTATPDKKSNVLHLTYAYELKQEEMIKLPVLLAAHPSWQSAVHAALDCRLKLETTAAREPDYIRPIILFQAQPRGNAVTVDVLRQHLIEVEQVPEAAIAIATGDQRELDGIDLFRRDCPITCVITQQALKEGWDCSFAYVFCSVARVQSGRAAEQLFGRVLRMPYARRRNNDDLNRAYAFLSEPVFQEAAQHMQELLGGMGFDAAEIAESVDQLEADFGLFAARDPERPLVLALDVTPEEVAEITPLLPEGARFEQATTGQGTVIIVSTNEGSRVRAIAAVLPQRVRAGFIEEAEPYLAMRAANMSAAERGAVLRIPALLAAVQGELVFADSETFLEDRHWSLLDHPARLGEAEFTVRQEAGTFVFDVKGRRLEFSQSGSQQLSIDLPGQTASEADLVLYLDRQLRAPDIKQADLIKWLSDLLVFLQQERGVPLAVLDQGRFILARKLLEKLKTIRTTERERAYQACLFAPDAKVAIDFKQGFEFRQGIYRDVRLHQGAWRPMRHFLGPKLLPAFDGATGGAEEQCARVIDAMPGIRYWLRNVAAHPASFNLPTAAGRFFPDFVAELEDGRLLVVEYKGDPYWADAAEDRAIGRLWEQAMGEKGLFLMVRHADPEHGDVAAQIERKITLS